MVGVLEKSRSPSLTSLDVALSGWREVEGFVAQRVSGLFEISKNPSLTLRVSFGFPRF